MRKLIWWLFPLMLILPIHAQQEADPIVFGMILVGPKDDQGWSQTHYEGGLFVENRFEAEMLLHENYNPSTADEKPMAEIVGEFIDQGAQIIFLTSASFQQEAEQVARLYPQVSFVHIAGDSVLTGTAPDNLSNLMGQMEWAKLMNGCLAALMTETGHLGYLGPLVNAETRRLAASAYLGARHCYQRYREKDPETLQFTVEWVGYWFFIPGVTEDPTELTHTLYDIGADVVISGIDTPEALEVGAQRRENGENVYAVSYNSQDTCESFEETCIGTAYYSWGPAYLEHIEAVADGTWEPNWDWRQPRSLYAPQAIVRFQASDPVIPSRAGSDLEGFRLELNAYNNNSLLPSSFPLWQGPLELQDGTPIAEDGELVNVLDVWYLPQLLQGMDGASFPTDTP